MSTVSDSDDQTHSTVDYLRLVFLDPITLAGLAVLVAGIVLVIISNPGTRVGKPMLGGALMLVGTVLFALGYTRAQWGLERWG
ncbi:hypothetical protein [Haladaptatus caseinilyticus]|uniref:hypothetical protein n=1 Tax=Haladaptatus caseinilyticus TaxID=2993314 RepID=UPI00224ABC72|nr:hypothetical protein [Haladaptatus caseinilyticus]